MSSTLTIILAQDYAIYRSRLQLLLLNQKEIQDLVSSVNCKYSYITFNIILPLRPSFNSLFANA